MAHRGDVHRVAIGHLVRPVDAHAVAAAGARAAHARAAGLPVTWSPGSARRPGAQSVGDGNGGEDFHFSGLPASADLPGRWLEATSEGEDAIRIELLPARAAVALGPEPVIEPQRIVLSLNEHRVLLATDGLSPFAVQPAVPADAR